MLLVKQCRSGDFCKACLHILRSVVRPLAPPLTQASAGVEPSRQTDPCVLAGLQNAGRFAWAGREVTECMHVDNCANFSAGAACQARATGSQGFRCPER